jgi:hypothetical protein
LEKIAKGPPVHPKSAIEKFGRDFYAFWASQGIAQGILPLLLRQTGIHA